MKKGTIPMTIGLMLIAAAISITVYNLWDNHRAGITVSSVLELLMPHIKDNPVPEEGRLIYDEIEYPDYVLNPEMDMPVQIVDGKEFVGVLSIPALDKKFPVFNEWNYTNLKTSVCRYVGTAYLDNMVICAHNYDKHFGLIKHLSYGDTVLFTDMDGNIFTYEVIEIETLQPNAIEEMTTGDWDLTLFTCTLGGGSRVTVRCDRCNSNVETHKYK